MVGAWADHHVPGGGSGGGVLDQQPGPAVRCRAHGHRYAGPDDRAGRGAAEPAPAGCTTHLRLCPPGSAGRDDQRRDAVRGGRLHPVGSHRALPPAAGDRLHRHAGDRGDRPGHQPHLDAAAAGRQR